jgi:hypothetical protein
VVKGRVFLLPHFIHQRPSSSRVEACDTILVIWRTPASADRRWRRERFDQRSETLFSALGAFSA